jgi:hypothetical protein
MSCNCKGNRRQAPAPIDKLVGFELINKGVIREEELSKNERDILYKFYNEQYNENVMMTCLNCWDDYIKEKLRELWIRESLERAQS